MLCCNFLKNTNVFNSVLIQLYGRDCLPGTVIQSMLQWAIALCRRVQLNVYSAPWLCGWWQVVRAQRLLSPHFPFPPLLPFWSFGEVSAELGGRNMLNCCQNQPPQYFQSLPPSFSFWGNLSCAGELWGKMILRLHLLTCPLFGTKNKARFPKTYSQGLFFSVLHCGVFLPWCCLCRIPQRMGGSEDICLPLSGSESAHDSCMAKPHCLPSYMRNKMMYIPCSCWGCIWPCNLPRYFKLLRTLRKRIPCWDLLQLSWPSNTDLMRTAPESIHLWVLKGETPSSAWSMLNWAACLASSVFPALARLSEHLQGALWHSPILWDHCCGLRETLCIQTSDEANLQADSGCSSWSLVLHQL